MSTFKDKANPIPQGLYLPSARFGSLIFTAGMTPRKNGMLIQTGKVRTENVASYKTSVIQAVDNALTAANNSLSEQERLGQILLLTVYINAEETFQDHTKLADYASQYIQEELGSSSIGSRAAIGVASLPGNAPVEIQLIASVTSQ